MQFIFVLLTIVAMNQFDSSPASAITLKPDFSPKEGLLFLGGGSLEWHSQGSDIFDALVKYTKQRTKKTPSVAIFPSGGGQAYWGYQSYNGSGPNDLDSYGGFFPLIGMTSFLVPIGLDNFVGKSYHPKVKEHDVASDAAYAQKIRDAQVVFLSGGDQARHYRVLKNNNGSDALLMTAIRSMFDRGGIIFGTSAGTMVMSTPMYSTGFSYDSLMVGDAYHAPLTEQLGEVRYDKTISQLYSRQIDGYTVDADDVRFPLQPTLEDVRKHPRAATNCAYGEGLDLVKSAIFDTHFDQRGRHGRLIDAMAGSHTKLGIGVDENTVLIVNKSMTMARVVGQGTATIIDTSEASFGKTKKGYLKAKNIHLTILSGGDWAILKNHRVVSLISDKPPHTLKLGKSIDGSRDIFAEYEVNRSVFKMLNAGASKIRTFAVDSQKQNPDKMPLIFSRLPSTKAYVGPYQYSVNGKFETEASGFSVQDLNLSINE